jgi:hypothetical protein
MNHTAAAASNTWATTAMDFSELRAHIGRCNSTRERWFMLRCVADAVHDFVAPRFVTTLFIASAVIGITALAL